MIQEYDEVHENLTILHFCIEQKLLVETTKEKMYCDIEVGENKIRNICKAFIWSVLCLCVTGMF